MKKRVKNEKIITKNKKTKEELRKMEKLKINRDIKNNEYSFISTKNNKKGITLIALVITIIVLLILARSNDCNVNR